MKQWYLRIIESDKFSFVESSINKITQTDIPIDEEDYNRWAIKNGTEALYRLKKNHSGSGLFDYIEEYIPEIVENTTPTIEDRIKALELTMLEVL